VQRINIRSVNPTKKICLRAASLIEPLSVHATLAYLISVIRMQIQFMLFAVFFGALAIAVKLTSQLQRSWVERDLLVGDLRVLSDIAFRKIAGPGFDQVQRLRKRGFLVKTARGRYRMTLMGWVAVLVRNTSARRVNKLTHQ
jgi:hypothetical protein